MINYNDKYEYIQLRILPGALGGGLFMGVYIVLCTHQILLEYSCLCVKLYIFNLK